MIILQVLGLIDNISLVDKLLARCLQKLDVTFSIIIIYSGLGSQLIPGFS